MIKSARPPLVGQKMNIKIPNNIDKMSEHREAYGSLNSPSGDTVNLNILQIQTQADMVEFNNQFGFSNSMEKSAGSGSLSPG